MTEVQFDRKSFLGVFEALETQFELKSPVAVLETEESGERFTLSATRADGAQVKAFGPCEVKGERVSVEFDLQELHKAIKEAHEGVETDKITLLVGNGLWVMDPTPAKDDA